MGPSVSGGCLLQMWSKGLGPLSMMAPSHSLGEDLVRPRLEEEIDSLAQELALKEKEAEHSRLTAQPWPEAAQNLLEPGEDPCWLS